MYQHENSSIVEPGTTEVRQFHMSDILLANREIYKMVEKLSEDP